MTKSKKLVACSANRMITFYDLDKNNFEVPYSRIEDLVGIPLCIEYHAFPAKIGIGVDDDGESK